MAAKRSIPTNLFASPDFFDLSSDIIRLIMIGMIFLETGRNGPPSDTVFGCTKTIVRPPLIDPRVCMKWGLALLGKERAGEYLAWLQARLGAEN